MNAKILFLALICSAALALLLVSRLVLKESNPALDTELARIVLLALGALILVWQLGG